MCENQQNIFLWNESKLKKTGLMHIFDIEYKGSFRFEPVYSGHLAVLIDHLFPNIQLKESLREIMNIEQKVRNVAAYKIVSVTDEWFKKNTGKTANEIMKIVKVLFRYAGKKADKDDRDSYLHMNKLVEKEL